MASVPEMAIDFSVTPIVLEFLLNSSFVYPYAPCLGIVTNVFPKNITTTKHNHKKKGQVPMLDHFRTF